MVTVHYLINENKQINNIEYSRIELFLFTNHLLYIEKKKKHK